MHTPIYILPGWTYDDSKWQPLLEKLSENGRKVELLKIPGLTGEELAKAWKLEDYVEWLHGMVGKEEKVILMGHSNGGRIAIAYAAKYKKLKRIEKLVLIDSAGLVDRRLKVVVKRAIFGAVAKLGKKITRRGGVAEKILYKLAREQDYHQASKVMKQTMQNLIAVDLTSELQQIATPTLLIWGEEDTATPLFQGKAMAKLIAGSKLEVVMGARHSTQFTNLSKVEKILAGFLV
jgi:pimeloyl-ACP methyl ester carboxylesterase